MHIIYVYSKNNGGCILSRGRVWYLIWHVEPSTRQRSHGQAFRSKLGSYILIPELDTAFCTCFITREEFQCPRVLDEVQGFGKDV